VYRQWSVQARLRAHGWEGGVTGILRRRRHATIAGAQF